MERKTELKAVAKGVLKLIAIEAKLQTKKSSLTHIHLFGKVACLLHCTLSYIASECSSRKEVYPQGGAVEDISSQQVQPSNNRPLQSKACHTRIGLASIYRQSAQVCTDGRVPSPVTAKPIMLNTETRWESLWGTWIQMQVPVQHLLSFGGKNQYGWKRIICCYVALTLFITGVLDHWISSFPLLSHRGLCSLI